MSNNTIHICASFDRNYLRHFFALAASIFDNNSQNQIFAHCIATGLTGDEKKLVEKYFQENNGNITFYEIDEAVFDNLDAPGIWSIATYYRLLFPSLVPEDVKTLLYLDTDMIVVNDLSPLYNTDLKGYIVGAVPDNLVRTAPQLGIFEEGNYFNAGMLLINVPAWEDGEITRHTLEYLRKYPERINYVDQCALNAVLINRWKKLDWRYNVLHSQIPEAMTSKEKKEFIAEKVILHYTQDRPWKMLCRHQFRTLYQKYLALSPSAADKYIDYSIKKVPHFLKIRATELYFNMPILKAVWRKSKKLKSF